MLESTTVPLHQILTQKIIYMRNFAPIFDFNSMVIRRWQYDAWNGHLQVALSRLKSQIASRFE